METLIENSGEVTEELENSLVINKEEMQHKGLGYGYIIKQFETNCDIIDVEIERLTRLKKVNTNAANRLKSSLSTAMQVFEIEELKSPTLKINFRKSKTVEIINLAQLDEKFIVIKETKTPDKKAIKDALDSGQVVDGAIIQENKNIQIK